MNENNEVANKNKVKHENSTALEAIHSAVHKHRSPKMFLEGLEVKKNISYYTVETLLKDTLSRKTTLSCPEIVQFYP